MKVSLKQPVSDVIVYGFKFDANGECECDVKVAQSLLDTGILVEVKTVKAKK